MQVGILRIFYIELFFQTFSCHDIVKDSIASRAEAEYNERLSGYRM